MKMYCAPSFIGRLALICFTVGLGIGGWMGSEIASSVAGHNNPKAISVLPQAYRMNGWEEVSIQCRST